MAEAPGSPPASSGSSGVGLSSRRDSTRAATKRARESSAAGEASATATKRARKMSSNAPRRGRLDERKEVSKNKGKKSGKARAVEEDEQVAEQEIEQEIEVCPITDKDVNPFRLMDLPPEVRIEIYRACLTRPFDVLLSREPKPVEERAWYVSTSTEVEDDGGLDDGEEGGVLLPPASGSVLLPVAADYDAEADAADDAANAAAYTSGGASSSSDNDWPMRFAHTRSRALMSEWVRTQANTATNAGNSSNTPTVHPATRFRTQTTHHRIPGSPAKITPRAPRPQDVDPLLINLLQANKLVYKESRAILYGENKFLLDLDTAQPTLAALHQRSRGQIKDLRVTIPTHNEILERFAEVVRLSLRYCWRLKRFIIHTPFVLPGAEGSSTSGNTTVYANAFDILRWLPRQCEVVLEGEVCEEIRKVVEKNSNLAKSLDELAYARRQLISNDAQRLPITG